jgi:RNA polymerase sigma-70 factor, ECF subfamily
MARRCGTRSDSNIFLFQACYIVCPRTTSWDMGGQESISTGQKGQDHLYRRAAEEFGPSLQRLARAYEADPEKRRDLIQDIHFQLWRSFQRYDGRCSFRTWIYRVAHHVAASHVIRERRIFSALVSLEQLEMLPDKAGRLSDADRRLNLDRLSAIIQRLKPLDRQVIISYLEDLDAVSIGEITGLSPATVAMRIHRIKNILAKWFHEKEPEGENDAR